MMTVNFQRRFLSISRSFWIRAAVVLPALFIAVMFRPNLLAARGQQEQTRAESRDQSSKVPRVSLGEITGTPGASLMIPLYYTADPNLPLRSLTVEIEYVSNSLKFQKVSRGVVTEEVGADVAATLTEGTPDEKGVTRSKLRIATSLVEKNPPKGIPPGLLAFLLFRISTEAKPFAIRMNAAVVSAEDLQNPPQKVEQIAAVPGLVVVELLDAMPEATCFFFSH